MLNCMYMQTWMAICVTGSSSVLYQAEGGKLGSHASKRTLEFLWKVLLELQTVLFGIFGIVSRISRRCSRKDINTFSFGYMYVFSLAVRVFFLIDFILSAQDV